MEVTIHGPDLSDRSEGTFRVHAADAPENQWEVEQNGSTDPDTVEVVSREHVVDRLYDAEEYQREPDDLSLYLADVYFGPSCEDLPEVVTTLEVCDTPSGRLLARAMRISDETGCSMGEAMTRARQDPETQPEGEDEVTDLTNDPRLTQALEVYERARSFRAVGRELGVTGQTAKKLVEAAQATRAPAATANGTRKPREGGNPNYPAPQAKRQCLYPDHEGENPLPFEDDTHFGLHRSGARAGSAVGWCRGCQKLYAAKARKAKVQKAKDQATVEATPEPVAA